MARSWKPCLKFFSQAIGDGRAFISKRTRKIIRSLKPILKFISCKSPACSFCLSLLPSRTQRVLQEPPPEFQCPISGSLLYDPVTAPNSQTYDRVRIEACRELNYIPYSRANDVAPSSPIDWTPNEYLKSKILDWCNRCGQPSPRPISREEACYRTSRFQPVFPKVADDGSGDQHQTAQGDDQDPPSSCAATSIGESSDSRTLPSSSDAVDVTCTSTGITAPIETIRKILMKPEIKKIPAKATTIPTSSYFSKAMEILSRSRTSAAGTASTATSIDADPMEMEILKKLKDQKSSVREEALVTIYKSAKRSRDCRIALCSHKILANIVPKLQLRHPPTQIIKAAAAIASLSEEPSIRVMIARTGVISRLLAVLKNRDIAAHAIVARALKNLAMEERNKESIGTSPDAISALVNHFCDPAGGYRGRKYAGMALCHLTFNFPDNLTRLAETAGAVQKLLKLATDRTGEEAMDLGGFAMVLIWKLAWISEVREALIDEGVVAGMVRMMREGTGDEDFALAVMYQIQTCEHKGALFKELANSEGAEELLSQDKEGWGEVGREMARRMFDFIRQDDHDSVELMQPQANG